MKIAIGDFTIFDHATDDGALFEQSGEIRRMVQVVDRLRADEVRTFFRGNKRTSFSFSICRPITSEGSALEEWFMHESEIPSDADLTITSTDGTKLIRIAGNLEALGLPQRMNKRIWHRYSFTGGKPSVETLIAPSVDVYDGSLRSTATTLLFGNFDADVRAFAADTYDFAHA